MCVSHLYQYASPKCRDRSICKRTPLAQIHNRCETWTCLCPYLHWFGIVTAEGELPGRGGGNGAKAYHNRREEDAATRYPIHRPITAQVVRTLGCETHQRIEGTSRALRSRMP